MNKALAVACLMLVLAIAVRADSSIKSLDTDNDGALDMAEVETSAAKVFAALDTDMEGTLDARELAE
jgi:hypothetical protein